MRHFEAIARAPDGTRLHGASSVRTGSCKHRFELSAPRRVALGSKLRIRITDRWGLGDIRPRLCVDPPRATPTCHTISLGKAVTVASRSVRVTTRGSWRVQLRVGGSRIRTSVTVGRRGRLGRKPPPTLLTTGDSTMQGIDNFLADRLGDRANVRSDIIVGSGLSEKPFWRPHAVQQTAELRQRTTVISVGANEGFAMTNPAGTASPCCAGGWIAEYSRRVRAMMKTYVRRGRARVVWLTQPLPRDPERAVVASAVNASVRAAAQGHKDVFVLPFDEIFTPAGYSDVIRWQGQYVRVRQPDGVHLNLAGTSIAAAIIDGFLEKLEE